MTAKSIIDVEINDKKFKAFSKLYERYQGALAKAPGQWGAVNKEIGNSRKGFEAIAAALLAQNDLTRREIENQKKNTQAAEGTARVWLGMSRSTKEVAGNIARATTSLLKWGGLTSFISGVLGAGGLFGIDRLAASVAANRRSATGLGVSYGQQQAFGINFRRFIDPDSVLSSVAGGLSDKTSAAYTALRASGANVNGNAAAVAADVLRQIPRLFGGMTDPGLIGAKANALGFGNLGISAEDIKRVLAGPKEFGAQDRSFLKDSRSLDIDAATQKTQRDLLDQLDRAALGIHKTFVIGLAPLSQPLQDLSTAFEKTVATFLRSDLLVKWIEQAGTGLEKFATYIGTSAFEENVRSLVTGIGRVASAVSRLVQAFGGGESGPAISERQFGQGALGQEPDTEGQRKFNGWMNYLLGYKIDKTSGLDKDFSARLSQLRAAVPPEFGPVTITSGYRSREDQARLYANRGSNPYPVAAPGMSEHERGLAADLGGSSAALAWLHAHARDYGLDFPLKSDPVHVHRDPNVTPQKIVVEIISPPGGSAITAANQVAQ